MKRWSAGLSMVLVLFVAGCGKPAGTDGDLINGWKPLGTPGVPVPNAGECWTFTGTADKIEVGPGLVQAECTAVHASETFYVGQFAGNVADKATVPAGADLSEAYAACEQKAKPFLGGDWHDGKVLLKVLPPSTKQWDADARYYRCDMVEVADDTYTISARSSSLKDGLSGNRPAEIGCVEVKTDSADLIEDFVPTRCESTHNGEYVGTFYSPDNRPYPTDINARRSLLQPGCHALVSKFLGLTDAELDADQQFTFAWSTASPTRWSYGDRTARCYLMLDGKLTVGRSLKGNGNKPV